MIRRKGLVLAVGLLGLAATAGAADWWQVHRADAAFDLPAARSGALEVVASQPTSADAVAAAGWWLSQVDNLRDPGEILAAVNGARDPELGFMLARIEAALDGRPPAGVLATAELVGPYGVFGVLELERRAAPPEEGLPPPGTVFVDPWEPVRYRLTSVDGTVAPPEVLTPRGLYVAIWTFRTERELNGWLAVEVQGSFDLELDRAQADRRRSCGLHSPGVLWYRVKLAAGQHRIRADFVAQGRPEIRVGLYGLDGAPLVVEPVTGRPDELLAPSEIRADEPPAAAALEHRLATEPTAPELLLAASLAEHRRDPVNWRHRIEAAAAVDSASPWPALAMTWYWLTAPSLDDAEAIRRRAREELRPASQIPLALLYERALAVRESREEDARRVLDVLVDEHGEDVRVLRMWIHEALQRGWAREAEDALQRLHIALPGSREAAEVELDVLEALERWAEREHLLRALAAAEPADLHLVDDLANGCLVDEAIAVMEQLRDRVAQPDLDIELVRLLFTAGRLDEASAELAALRARWGSVRAADELALAITSGDAEASADVLSGTLERAPSAIELLSLAWRRGKTPFFEPYRLSLDEVRARVDEEADEVDAVLLLDQAVEKVFIDGSSLYYYHGVTRALTPVGARQAARLQQLPNSHRLKIRIHKPDGSIVVPAAIGSSGAVVLDEVEPGDLVEEEYVARVAPAGASRRGHLPPYIYRFADSERAFGLSEYLLLVPPEIELLLEGNFEGLERTEWDADGLRAVRWRAERVPPLPEERFAPPTSELLPWVSYGFGVTWQDIGDAVRDRLDHLLVTSPELDQWSAPLLAAADTTAAVAALVDGVVSDVEVGRGGLDFSSSASASFSRRVGNRLGIVAAVLLDAGWQVDLVMARTRPYAGTHLVVPTFDAFVLPLLRVERDGSELWLDLDEERRGVGHIDPILQGSDGLLVPLGRPLEEARLIPELPTFENPDLEEEMRVLARIDPAGDAEVNVILPIRGPQAERVVEQIRSVPEERVPMIYEQMAANFVPAASDVTGSVERVDGGVDLSLTMRASGVCRPENGSMVCRALVFSKPLAPVLAALPTRQFDLIMPVPVLQRNILTIELPEGWSINAKPRRIETRWGSVVETIEAEGRQVVSDLRLELPAQTVTPEEYQEFARFCHAVDELTTRPPVLAR